MFTEIGVPLIILFFSIVLHEYAHGWMAYKLGDSTAKEAGRLTLNPFKHIDPVGTVILPIGLLILRTMGMNMILFGWAKPVPVNFLRLRHPKRSMMWVGLAGPAINVFLAFFFAKLLVNLNFSSLINEWLLFAVFINLLLAIFNMIPIPPLDGSRFVMGLLPNSAAGIYARLEPFGILIVMLIVATTDIFEEVLFPMIQFCGNLMGVSI